MFKFLNSYNDFLGLNKRLVFQQKPKAAPEAHEAADAGKEVTKEEAKQMARDLQALAKRQFETLGSDTMKLDDKEPVKYSMKTFLETDAKALKEMYGDRLSDKAIAAMKKVAEIHDRLSWSISSGRVALAETAMEKAVKDIIKEGDIRSNTGDPLEVALGYTGVNVSAPRSKVEARRRAAAKEAVEFVERDLTSKILEYQQRFVEIKRYNVDITERRASNPVKLDIGISGFKDAPAELLKRVEKALAKEEVAINLVNGKPEVMFWYGENAKDKEKRLATIQRALSKEFRDGEPIVSLPKGVKPGSAEGKKIEAKTIRDLAKDELKLAKEVMDDIRKLNIKPGETMKVDAGLFAQRSKSGNELMVVSKHPGGAKGDIDVFYIGKGGKFDMNADELNVFYS